ncbi:hypothetical protein [Zwartia sp.]|uniref:hypothetical protein n=1 Tax=Zwartia sp. TaxID=2978004 RepID=UPI0027293C1F|nr:hypothetical protein [Zwartia sp.]MDO9024067.1 hypothetical protein [Zwartia sp.]
MAAYKPEDLFGIPDELKIEKKRSAVQRSAKKVPKATAPTLPGQGFLPGLSRRGRPRLTKPISPVERTAEHRRKRIANGAKRVEIILDSDVSQALDRLAEHHHEPRSEVIATLIRKADARLKR